MSTSVIERPRSQQSHRRARALLCGATVLTYAVGLWIIIGNPFLHGYIDRPPLEWSGRSETLNMLMALFVLVFGSTPIECLTRIAVIAILVQCFNYLAMDADDIDLDRNRPYVFWRAMGRFVAGCLPFLRGKSLDAPPSTSLTEYERITVRYLFVKLIFLPIMTGFFFSTFQQLLSVTALPWSHAHFDAFEVQRMYVLLFTILMTLDIGWFAVGCTVETGTYSPIKMVDPFASGWIVTLACYPPLVSIAGQFFSWGPPTFPALTNPKSACVYAAIGLFLYTFYVIADFSFGLKCGNLTYRGLVDKGPYRWVRHPMYASKNIAWFIFTIPLINFHIAHTHVGHISLPVIAANWGILGPIAAWISIYAARGLTEERYLLTFPEYREYCKRVRYRFIPGVL